ncbi:MAG: CRISPR system Cmr subunit Cmr5 [Candidatus Poribacteria bacterium]|nr:MAG: CRISPR system Cmr subunit Cmr5 [Candidatus Poribacteria bacterium]
MQTRDQLYAQTVYAQVSQMAGEEIPKSDRNAYGSMAHRLPALIRSAGLAQALAFVEARGKEPHKRLLDHLAQTLGEGSRSDLLERSRRAELPEYLDLTRRALAALNWYKRFAQSILEVESGIDDSGE